MLAIYTKEISRTVVVVVSHAFLHIITHDGTGERSFGAYRNAC